MLQKLVVVANTKR